MTPDLSGKTAIVTGAGRGIGRSISLALADAGAKLVAVSRTEEQLDDLVHEIESRNGVASRHATDISEENEVRRLFDSINASCDSIDILINNAGIGAFGTVVDFSPSDFDRVIATNLRGTFLCCRQAMRSMISKKSGYIINISSVVGIKGYPRQAAYTASKHGLMGFTKSLAVEAQEHGIRVSAVLPGGVDTEMAAHARPDLDRTILLHPDDVTGAVMYLLSLSERAAVDEIYIRRVGAKPF